MSVLSWKLQGNIKLEIPVFVEFLFQFYIILKNISQKKCDLLEYYVYICISYYSPKIK